MSKIRYHLYEYYKGRKNYYDAITNLEYHVTLEKELHKNAINQKVTKNFSDRIKAVQSFSQCAYPNNTF